MDITTQRKLASLLASLRRNGRQQSGLEPRLVPPDAATAYRVAGLVAEELGWPVLGWKIAAFKEEMQQALRTDSPIYGRTFFVKETPVTVVHARLASFVWIRLRCARVCARGRTGARVRVPVCARA